MVCQSWTEGVGRGRLKRGLMPTFATIDVNVSAAVPRSAARRAVRLPLAARPAAIANHNPPESAEWVSG